MSAPELHISSLLVQCRPERLGAVSAAIEAYPEAEVHGRDPRGKLIVTIETECEAALTARLDAIGRLAGVLTASLVYHQVEQA